MQHPINTTLWLAFLVPDNPLKPVLLRKKTEKYKCAYYLGRSHFAVHMQQNGISDATLQRFLQIYGEKVQTTTADPSQDCRMLMKKCYFLPNFGIYVGYSYNMPSCNKIGYYK